MAVAAGDGFKSNALECLYCCQLRLLAAHLESGYLAVRSNLKRVAEDSRHTELLHERTSKLGECIGNNDHLGDGPQLVEELLRAGHGVDLCDGVLDLLQTKAVLLEDTKAPLHQLVVIRLVTGGALQLRDSACFCECDPDFGYQYALEIKAGNIHGHCFFLRSV